MKAQKEALIEQTQMLLMALDKLGRVPPSSGSLKSETPSSPRQDIPSEKYSEIIEETGEEK